jgi:putative CocE/NonD family hydrolase
VRIFVMGANVWREEQDWPLARALDTPWYLHADGRLSPDAPGEEAPDEFTYDPAEPAPTIGGPTSLPDRFLGTNSGPLDQRELEARDDVLVYTSAPLDADYEVTGPLTAVVWAATSARDTDFVVKLTDVDPEGGSRILAEGVIRARFRDGYDAERLIEPGEVLDYRVDLVATANAFLAGHRIRVLVTSSSFPRFDRNPNTGAPLGVDGPEDLVVAQQTIFHDTARPSHIVLPVVPS